MTKDFLLNKNILITGATSGIGKSLTKYLSEHGANILMLSKDESKLDVLYDEIVKKYNTDPCIFKCDLQKLNEDSAIEINKIINENYSGVDAVIFNAAALEKMLVCNAQARRCFGKSWFIFDRSGTIIP